MGITLPFHRVELVNEFMILAVAVGVIHVSFGLILGIVNGVKTGHKKHVYEKGGILTLIVAIMLAVGIGMASEAFGDWAIWGQSLFALIAFGGFIFAVRGGGVMGVVETVESFTGMVSYIRIMAVGLAGAIFADAINSIVAGTTNVVLGAVIAVLLHSLNFIICAFSPSIHALRLNFLEFFGKFYETGNEMYSPFMKTGGEKSA